MQPEMVRTVSDYGAKLDITGRSKKEYKIYVLLLPVKGYDGGLQTGQLFRLSIYIIQRVQLIIAVMLENGFQILCIIIIILIIRQSDEIHQFGYEHQRAFRDSVARSPTVFEPRIAFEKISEQFSEQPYPDGH